MLKRRGFTLVELMVSIVLLTLVGVTLVRVMTSMLRVTTAQVQLTNAQGSSRTGTLAIPQELREVGYDTITVGLLPGPAITDLIAIAPNRVTFLAARGMGMTCGTPTDNEFRIKYPIIGMREPVRTDTFRMFVEMDFNLAGDDTWAPMVLTDDIDYNSTCGADKAIRFTIQKVVVNPITGQEMALSNIKVGGPIRWFEAMEYGPIADGGRAYIGARSLNLGQGTLWPLIGPLADTTGFSLTYYDSDGILLNPAVDDPLLVRSIGVNVIGATTGAIALSASSARSRGQMPAYTRVALRNTLRP